jgi:hypothetical protein
LVQQGRLEIDRILLAVDFDSYRGDDVITEMEDEINDWQSGGGGKEFFI